jgi:hypothetical protein
MPKPVTMMVTSGWRMNSADPLDVGLELHGVLPTAGGR